LPIFIPQCNGSHAENPPILHDFQDAFRNPWIQGWEHIEPPFPVLHFKGVIKTNQDKFANIFWVKVDKLGYN